jgi:ParB-like chromosome segregation protein Spo0J
MTDTPRFQIMPSLSPDDYASLEKSIIEHGVMLPIIVDENDDIIDGHHREQIAQKLDIQCPRDVRTGLTDAEKRAMALTLNIDRRHLTQQQKRELLEKSITADPQLSDREHGRRTGTDHKTATKVRDEMERRGEIPHVDKHTDTTGRQQPASKPNLTVVGSDTDNATQPKPKGPKDPLDSAVEGDVRRVVMNINIVTEMVERLHAKRFRGRFSDAHRKRIANAVAKLMKLIDADA